MLTLRRVLVTHLVLIAAVAPAARAQTGTITGTVVNAATRAPMEGVLLTMPGARLTTTSQANGAFTFLNVPPGAYVVAARQLGFATREFTGVTVQVGRTRSLTFVLRASATDTTERSEATTALVDPSAAGSSLSLTREQIVSSPVLSTSGALAENGGYLNVPSGAASLSLADLRRGVSSVSSIRAARTDATQFLLDGIPVTNPVFGSPPLLIEPLAAGNVTFSPAHLDAEHGGTLSGLVAQTVREGGPRTSGALEYQTSALAGALGSATSAISGTSAARGYIAGPLPYTNGAVRYSLAGHTIGERTNVRKVGTGPWEATGADEHNQFAGKLTYAARPTFFVSASLVAQHHGAVGIDPAYPTRADSVAAASVGDDSRLTALRFEKRFTHADAALTFSDHWERRETCNIWQGVCAEDRFNRKPIPAIDGLLPDTDHLPFYPYALSGQYFGGEEYHTRSAQATVVIQASDHHRIAGGIYAARHDIAYRDGMGTQWVLPGLVNVARDVYRTHPTEFATYFQDALEFDLVTIHLGARFDYGSTGGVAFVDPFNPTNGTTAMEVCNGTAPGINTTPFQYQQYLGLTACLASPLVNGHSLLDSASRLGQQDDFHSVRPRALFSPRIGLSFPLTEQSGLFINVGRYSKNPLYHDAFRNTGLGSRAGRADQGGDGMCGMALARPGTDECDPDLLLPRHLPEFVGNPDLHFEMATAWEAGFTSQVGRRSSVDASVYSSDQGHLPSVYTSRPSSDIGATYGLTGQRTYRGIASYGSNSTWGITVTFRQQQEGPLSYTVNYTWQHSSEIGAAPDLVAEAIAVNESFDNTGERRSARNRENTLNARLVLQWRQETPAELGRIGAALLRNSRTVLTVSAASGSETLAEKVCSGAAQCATFAGGIAGSGTLANVLYVRTLSTQGVRWAFIARVRNLLNVDDGSMALRSLAARFRPGQRQQASLRRILAGMSVDF